MNEIKGKNFSIVVDYVDNFIGIAVRLLEEDPEKNRAVAGRIDLDANHDTVAAIFEGLANRIRGLV
jgi:hypothetical protein